MNTSLLLLTRPHLPVLPRGRPVDRPSMPSNILQLSRVPWQSGLVGAVKSCPLIAAAARNEHGPTQQLNKGNIGPARTAVSLNTNNLGDRYSMDGCFHEYKEQSSWRLVRRYLGILGPKCNYR